VTQVGKPTIEATERKRELDGELEAARATAASCAPAVDASMKPPADLDIPHFLDRRPLLPDDQLAFDAIKTAWANSTDLRAALIGASPVVLERFLAVLREYTAAASSAAE
jgi:hypothetical protein